MPRNFSRDRLPPHSSMRPMHRSPKAVGVGHNFTAAARGIPPCAYRELRFVALSVVGVGHNPYPVAFMRSANGGSRNAVPFRVIPERGQVSEYVAQPSTKQRCDVLHDDVSGSNFANDSRVLAP